jgi:hypothetical protein
MITTMTMPDGQQVELKDWSSDSLYSCFTHFVFGPHLSLEDTQIQVGYTVRCASAEEIPAPITLEEFADRHDVSYWRLRCRVSEFLSRERRGMRSSTQYRRMYEVIW